MTKILSIGEVMLEMSDVGGGLFKKSFAGDTFNVAHYINVASQGRIRADYLTALGHDGISRECIDFLEQHGVSTRRVQLLHGRTIGLFILGNDAAGEKQYGYWRGQSAARHLFDQPQDLSGYDLVYFSGITAAITENKNNLILSIAEAKEKGARIVFDYNHRAQLWSQEEACEFARKILPLIDIVKISDEELSSLYNLQDVEGLSTEYASAEWVLTCGGKKAELWQNGQNIVSKSFIAVSEVVDSSAAGDAFIGTYLASRSEGDSLAKALDRAHQTAAQVVCAKGSIVEIDLSRLN
ncbi:sugar kinase [Kiloniella litopenaei]|uniref:sugar kinase n=1 Tax=Kiloniella litopenaei TaxID=1549748 RepID=UPI003BA8E1FC